MENNLESDVKYVPYKENAKKRALDYYYANREMIREKKIDNNPCRLNKKRRDKNPLNNGVIIKRQKKRRFQTKTREYHKNKYHNLMVAVK